MAIALTTADLNARFGADELTRLQDVGSNLDQILSDAAAEAEGYIRVRYNVALVVVDAALKAALCDLARYRVYQDNAPEVVRDRARDALRYLEAIAAGRVSLVVADDPATADDESTGTQAAFTAQERAFSRTAWAGF